MFSSNAIQVAIFEQIPSSLKKSNSGIGYTRRKSTAIEIEFPGKEKTSQFADLNSCNIY